MSLVSPVDPSPERVSACPVHFLWDGRGRGRAWVRSGFLGLVATGGLASAATVVRSDALSALAVVVGAAAGVAWVVGQALSVAARSRA